MRDVLIASAILGLLSAALLVLVWKSRTKEEERRQAQSEAAASDVLHVPRHAVIEHHGADEEWSPREDLDAAEAEVIDPELWALHQELEPAFAAAYAQFDASVSSAVAAFLRPLNGVQRLDALGLGATAEHQLVRSAG